MVDRNAGPKPDTGPDRPPPEVPLASLMQEADAGNDTAARDLFVTLYRELHGLAEHHLRRNSADFTLTATSLLHETYLNLAGRERASFPDQARFMGYASRAMRGLIIDYARARRAKKRGGEFEITGIGVEELPAVSSSGNPDLDRLGAAVEALGAIDAALAQLVDLHFFCGLSFVEIAAMWGVSERTVQRDWRKSRMLLQRLTLDQ